MKMTLKLTLLLLAVAALTGTALAFTTSCVGNTGVVPGNYKITSSGGDAVIYYHDKARHVGIWLYSTRGVFVLPDSQYTIPDGQ